MKFQKTKFIVGVDEVGRGPLAGPVMVCALGCEQILLSEFKEIKDSKMLTSKKRDEWFEKINLKIKEGSVLCKISSLDNHTIDKVGISKSIKRCVDSSIFGLKIAPEEAEILLDGGLKAPEIYLNQKTIIKGDQKETVISMASVMAKVVRDREMEKLDLKYPNYGFAKHKGYGTKAHYEAISHNGLCPLHRKSFCSKIL